MTMEEKITLFPVLPPAERREVEEYVDRHPDLRGALDGAREVARALREEGLLTAEPTDEEAVAFLAVMEAVDAERTPARLRTVLERMHRRVEEDPDLRERYAAARRRMLELEAASDIARQVERLGVSRARTAGSAREEREARGAVDRAAGSHAVRKRAVGRAAALMLAVVAAYGILYTIGRMARPEMERLATFDPSELTVGGYVERRGDVGSTPTVSEATARYLEALDHLRRAESTMLGLFPRFDRARLDAAAVDLQVVLELEPPESFLTAEAAFLLAKVELARGSEARARDYLDRVISFGGRRTADARRLLRALDT